jgi:hypothetical protein
MLSVKGVAPQPEALGAWIDCGTNTEAHILSVNDNTIEQEGLACPVFPCHCYNSDSLFDPAQELFGLL